MQKKKPEGEGVVKLYREFSRQKYNKYKHKFPKMKEREIITKVQKEWDSLDEEARANLQKFYQQKNFLADNDAEIITPKIVGARKEDSERGSRDSKTSKTKNPKLKVVQDVPEAMIDQSEQSSLRDKRKDNMDSGSQKEQDAPVAPRKGRKITKMSKITSDTKNKEYLTFFKYYHEKLTIEHAKWKPVQIGIIIKLLWKKRLITKKRDEKVRRTQVKTGKAYTRPKKFKRKTAYLVYKQKYIKENGPRPVSKRVKKAFNRLTFEAKYHYSRQAKMANNEYLPKIKRQDIKSRFASLESEVVAPNRSLEFMNRVIAS